MPVLRKRVVRVVLGFALLLTICSACLIVSARSALADPPNDYPSSLAPPVPQDSVVDPWGFFNRECTSFVAWRLNNNNKIPFQNNNYKVKGTHFGNAQSWGSVARSIGITVNNTPAIGAVAWWYFSSTSGHVAWVTHINSNGSVVVQDYNWGYPTNPGQFLEHTLKSAPTGYIHFKDISSGGGSNPPSTPVAVSRASTNMAVFYNDGNGGLVSWSWDVNSGWSSYTWHDTFGNGSDVINGQPCVVARDSSDMDVFYRTAQGRLIHRGWNATNGWEGPDVLLSSGVGDPACIARDPGDLQAFFRTPAGEIKSVSWNWQSSWNLNPQMLYSSSATSDPVAISRTSDSMDVFFGKNNGNLVHLGWTAAYGWNTQDWGAGSGVAGKPTAITRNGGGDMSSDYEESSGKLGEEFWNWQTGWGWQEWNAQLVGSPSAIAGVAYPIEVFYRETGGNIVDHYFNGTSWASNWIVGAGGATGNPYAIARGSNEDVFYWNHSTLMDADWNATNGWTSAPVR